MKKTNRIKGSGSVFKRENGNYYFQYMVNGKSKKISLKTKNKAEAIKKADEFVNEILKPAQQARTVEAVHFNVAESKKIIQKIELKLEKVWNIYIKSAKGENISEGTKKVYINQWFSFVKWLEKNYKNISSLTEITENIASDYMDYIYSTGISANTFNKHLFLLKIITKLNLKKINVNIFPFENLENRKIKLITKKELTEKQIENLLNVFDDDDFYLLYKNEIRLLFYIGVYSGMRLADCIQLQWSEIIDNNIEKICQKTKEKLLIPISSQLQKEFEKIEKKSDYVLPVLQKRYITSPANLTKPIRRVFKKSGIKILNNEKDEHRKSKAVLYGFHSLRHSFVSSCANKGIPMAIVQSMVGHTGPAMTAHYTHVSADAKKSALEIVFNNDNSKRKKLIEKINKMNDSEIEKILNIIG